MKKRTVKISDNFKIQCPNSPSLEGLGVVKQLEHQTYLFYRFSFSLFIYHFLNKAINN